MSPSDKIIIQSLALPLVTGADHWSRPLPTPHSITITLLHDLDISATQADELHGSINYSTTSKLLIAALSEDTFASPEECIQNGIEGRVLDVLGLRGGWHIELSRLKVLGVEKVVFRRTSTPSLSSSGLRKRDNVKLVGLKERCIIGINEAERLTKQEIEFDITFDLLPVTNQHPFEFEKYIEATHTFVNESSYQTLESLAHYLSQHLLSLPLLSAAAEVASTTVRVYKPYAITLAQSAGVEITRSPSDFPTASPTIGKNNIEGKAGWKKAIIAVGSNLTDRIGHINRAMHMLVSTTVMESGGGDERCSIKLEKTSRLYQSAPMYVVDQGAFVNGAVMISTTLSPSALLTALKYIESEVGRTPNIRNGPRVIDLDIIFYGQHLTEVLQMETAEGGLIVPHKSIEEREFVLRPVLDLLPPSFPHPRTNKPLGALLSSLPLTDQPLIPLLPLHLPSPPLLASTTHKTLIMSILNLTPDSFSDGSSYQTLSSEIEAAKKMISLGADILDVGGLSTRPGSAPVSPEEEIQRVVPLIKAIRAEGITTAISIDTYRATVAKAAVEAGASIINDVYGGRDDGMLAYMASSGVPVILMHSRGTSETMGSMTAYPDGDVVKGVIDELAQSVQTALDAGVNRWNIIIDPGIGFAKDLEGNLDLIARIKEFTAVGSPLHGYPVLMAASRKRFIGTLTGKEVPKERGYGSAAVVASSVLLGGCEIVRVHDTDETSDLLKVLDAVTKRRAA